MTLREELISATNGLKVLHQEGTTLFIENATFPFECGPTPEVLEALRLLKRIITLKWNPTLFKEIVSYILRWDWGWRVRFIDLLNSADEYELEKNPRKEIKRLMRINKERETPLPYAGAHEKIKRFGILLIVASYWPSIRKAIQTYPLTHITDQDLYWALQRTDYDILGLSYAQRREEMARRGWNWVVD